MSVNLRQTQQPVDLGNDSSLTFLIFYVLIVFNVITILVRQAEGSPVSPGPASLFFGMPPLPLRDMASRDR